MRVRVNRDPEDLRPVADDELAAKWCGQVDRAVKDAARAAADSSYDFWWSLVPANVREAA